jgi:hypothetical protein
MGDNLRTASIKSFFFASGFVLCAAGRPSSVAPCTVDPASVSMGCNFFFLINLPLRVLLAAPRSDTRLPPALAGLRGGDDDIVDGGEILGLRYEAESAIAQLFGGMRLI